MAALTPQRIQAVRAFNRFYTQRIGAVREGFLESPFSLSEVRVLYELAHRKSVTAAELARDLGLDTGYLSRILRRFVQRGLVSRKRSQNDGRQAILALTPRGAEAFAPLQRRQEDEVRALLARLDDTGLDGLLAAMRTIEEILGRTNGRTKTVVIRDHRPGDVGWVIQRHGALYAREYGWDAQFEALVAEIGAKFLREFDARRERCWIAEADGKNAGCVFCVNKGEGVAQLRLLLVEPEARGLGIGARLVDECIAFARRTGYTKIVLWTNDILHAARRIYERAGFRLVEEERHHSFGHDLVGQYWELALS
jgi:DNA-binding MarR family transcriptional regulator/N-acetylglutamate synthase-like GNAT family acetyltransferase